MLIEFFRHLKGVRTYIGFGLGAAAIYLIINAVLTIIVLSETKLENKLFLFITPIIDLTKVLGVTALGIYYCRLLNLNSAPLIMKSLKFDRAPGEHGYKSTLLRSSIPLVSLSFLMNNIHKLRLYKKPEMPDLKKLIYTVSIIATGSILYSVVLFLLTSPTVSRDFQFLNQYGLDNYTPPFFVLLIAVIFIAFVEEIAFRLGIQNFLAVYFKLNGKKYWLAILITAIIWTLGHWGAMDPGWVKMVQIFPAGLALGWTFKKYGIEACIIIHVLFNVIMAILAPHMIVMK